MARIAGVNIPTNKRVEVALAYIHGIGDTIARQICTKVAIPPERRVSQLTESEIIQIREYREKMTLLRGHSVSEEEAAERWISRNAEDFSKLLG